MPDGKPQHNRSLHHYAPLSLEPSEPVMLLASGAVSLLLILVVAQVRGQVEQGLGLHQTHQKLTSHDPEPFQMATWLTKRVQPVNNSSTASSSSADQGSAPLTTPTTPSSSPAQKVLASSQPPLPSASDAPSASMAAPPPSDENTTLNSSSLPTENAGSLRGMHENTLDGKHSITLRQTTSLSPSPPSPSSPSAYSIPSIPSALASTTSTSSSDLPLVLPTTPSSLGPVAAKSAEDTASAGNQDQSKSEPVRAGTALAGLISSGGTVAAAAAAAADVEGALGDHTLSPPLRHLPIHTATHASAHPIFLTRQSNSSTHPHFNQTARHPQSRPLVIAHRGASGYYPEHTRKAYEEAISMGADIIECDIVLTKDGMGICRHEPELSNTTDAMLKFPKRVQTYYIDGVNTTGIFSFDLTNEEIKTLRARQPWFFRSHEYDDTLPLVTLDEYLEIALNAPRPVAVYPELKSPSFHNSLPHFQKQNLTIERVLLHAMSAHGYIHKMGSMQWRLKPAFIQSFEPDCLKALAPHTPLPLIQLLGSTAEEPMPDGRPTSEMVTESALREISQYAVGIGPGKVLLADWDASALQYKSSGLIERAETARLLVHPYTLRAEPSFIMDHLEGNFTSELELLFATLCIDGAFTDQPDLVAQYLREEGPSLRKRCHYGRGWRAALRAGGSTMQRTALQLERQALANATAFQRRGF